MCPNFVQDTRNINNKNSYISLSSASSKTNFGIQRDISYSKSLMHFV